MVDAAGEVVGGLGARVREARHRAGLNQRVLAAPEFTWRFVNAVEHERMRPSRLALDVLARRLALPLTPLLAARPPQPADLNLRALDEDVAYQLDYVKRLLEDQRNADAQQLIASIEADAGPHLWALPAFTRYRFLRLRASVAVRHSDPARALPDLEVALRLAHEVAEPEEVERVRNVLGAVYFQAEQPQLALLSHARGLHAIESGVVKDRVLQMHIISNLASAYWACNAPEAAIPLYHEALDLLQDVNLPEREAAICWGLCLAYKAVDDLDRALLYARRGLALYEEARNHECIAQMASNLAWILIARGEYQPAAVQLARAARLLENANQPVILSTVYEHYADLERRRERIAEARTYAERSLQLSAAAFAEQTASGTDGATLKANTVRAYALALRTSALIEEQAGQPDAADALFAQARALIARTGATEAAADIELDYADVLAGRGAFIQAVEHYQAAVQHHPQLSRIWAIHVAPATAQVGR